MKDHSATALAHPNIALIKYWGNLDDDLRIPANNSISMNMEGLFTRTTVTFSDSNKADSLHLDNKPVSGRELERVSHFLDLVRQLAGMNQKAKVVSENNFPSGAGIASSASAFAALALAGSKAAGAGLEQRELSRLARRGSGSACRSIPAGFVEWKAGTKDSNSLAVSIAPPDHWDLVNCVAIVSSDHKRTSSTQGHVLASSSPLQAARVADTPRRLNMCRQAISDCDFNLLAAIVELDSDMMHAIMMTSDPSLFYLQPASLLVMNMVRKWRREGLPVCYTVDAGPNIHVLCPRTQAESLEIRLRELPEVQDILVSGVGGAARLVS